MQVGMNQRSFNRTKFHFNAYMSVLYIRDLILEGVRFRNIRNPVKLFCKLIEFLVCLVKFRLFSEVQFWLLILFFVSFKTVRQGWLIPRDSQSSCNYTRLDYDAPDSDYNTKETAELNRRNKPP